MRVVIHHTCASLHVDQRKAVEKFDRVWPPGGSVDPPPMVGGLSPLGGEASSFLLTWVFAGGDTWTSMMCGPFNPCVVYMSRLEKTQSESKGVNHLVLDIWARGTYTARIFDHAHLSG